MSDETILNRVKDALRITRDTSRDELLKSYIEAAKLDLGIAGVEYPALDDLVSSAVITYAVARFASTTDSGIDVKGLLDSYAMQKAQLMTATGYTRWGCQ